MQQELVLKAVTHSSIGIAILTLLLVLLIGLRKELDIDTPVRGIVHLGIVVLALCAFMASMVALFQARKLIVPENVSQGLDTAGISTASMRTANPSQLAPDISLATT